METFREIINWKTVEVDGFHLGQEVVFKLKPQIKGIITSITFCADGGYLLKVDFIDGEDNMRTIDCYAAHIEAIDATK